MDRLSEQDYQKHAFPELSALLAALDAYPDQLFAELGADVLTIEFDDQARYVVNSHLAARQIWLAAERSAWHFDYDAASGQWRDTKTQVELWAQLEQVLTRKLGRTVTLARPRR